MHLVATLQSWLLLLTLPPLGAVMARMASTSILCRRRVGLNDPNGLCQAGGVFHAYFQYAPFDVEGGVKAWGHATSRDLMTWGYVGAPLLPDEPFDCHGVYSGSALAEDGRIRVLYTGNVKLSDADARTTTSIPAAAPIPSMSRALMLCRS